MPRFAVSTGDGNMGVSHMYPDGYIEAPTLDAALTEAISTYAALLPEPDYTDGDDEQASAVWDETAGAPALNGGAAFIIEVWPEEE